VDIETVPPYPVRLTEIFKPKLWGGRNLERVLGKRLPPGEVTGESWEVTDRPGDVNVVANGECAGQDLHTLLQAWGGKLLGCAGTERGRFPLLYKFIDANQMLSVQVHPDDLLARELNEPDVGKTEMWYVINAPPGGKLILGLRPDVTAETFREALAAATLEPMLVEVPVAAGDAVFVAPGTVHAICEGIVLAEIQQNSDLTYRVYDWGRVADDGNPRPLHIEKAISAIAFGRKPPGVIRPLDIPADGAHRQILAASPYLAAERIDVQDAWTECITGLGSFRILSCLEGEGTLASGTFLEPFRPGSTLIVPAAAGRYLIEGPVELLKFYVPDIEREVVPALQAAGHSDDAIGRLAGIGLQRL